MLQIFRLNTLIFFILLIVIVSIFFDLIRKGKIGLPYQRMKDDNKLNKKEESGYLFLNGSYFMKYPYVDSYPQY